MSNFLSNIKRMLRISEDDSAKRKKELYKNIKTEIDPQTLWEIIGEIGDGAFGKVYKAENKGEGTTAALKQVEIKSEHDLVDFIIEIDILSECKHKNIVDLHEAFYFDDKLWMYIEFCEGGALDSIMVDLEKGLTEEQIQYVAHEMCEGLEFLHSRHVIHRDLKAGNVLVTNDGGVKLADFGVSAKNTKTTQRRDTFIGTPYWMAPEVIMCETLKDTPYNFKADIWSLGITLIEFAQIEPPNHNMHPMRVLIKIQKSDPPFFDRPNNWSSNFRNIVTKCLNKDPEKRPSAAELLQHPFLHDATNRKPLINLVSEARAEVVEIINDLSEDDEIKQIKENLSVDSQSVDFDQVSLTRPEGELDNQKWSENEIFNHKTVPLLSDSEVTYELSVDEKSEGKEPTAHLDSLHQSIDLEGIKLQESLASDKSKEQVSEQISESTAKNIDDKILQMIIVELIDEVIQSTTVQPSVPAVVLDTVQDVVFEPRGDESHETKSDDVQNDLNYNRFKKPEEILGYNDFHIIPPPPGYEAPGSYSEEKMITNIDDLLDDRSNVREVDVMLDSVRSSTLDSSTIDSNFTLKPAPSFNSNPYMANGHVTRAEDLSPSYSQNHLVAENRDDDLDRSSECGSVATVESAEGESIRQKGSLDRPRGKRKLREESKSQYRTIKKTRKFVVDGVVMTSTTTKVVQAGHEQRYREEHELRKKDLRELKLLQKLENKQYQDMDLKAQLASSQQNEHFNQEIHVKTRQFDVNLENLMRQQKQQVEKAEMSQMAEMKNAKKKLITDQDKEYRSFKEYQKHEFKLLKQELDLYPKESRKDMMKRRREEKEMEQSEKEYNFVHIQQERVRQYLDKIVDQHRQKIAMLESQFLEQKQHLIRAREAALWDLEKNHLHDKHQLAKSQLKDFFILRRQQMIHRHQKELEQMKRINLAREDEMFRRHVEEKKRLPKIQKAESKTRAQMFKQSLRLNSSNQPEDDRIKIKQFEENEKKRMKSEQLRQELKHKKQWDDLINHNENNMKELEQLQAEKRKMLSDHENQKMKELDDQYANELREWDALVQPRKQKLEEDFSVERNEQTMFYMSDGNTVYPDMVAQSFLNAAPGHPVAM